MWEKQKILISLTIPHQVLTQYCFVLDFGWKPQISPWDTVQTVLQCNLPFSTYYNVITITSSVLILLSLNLSHLHMNTSATIPKYKRFWVLLYILNMILRVFSSFSGFHIQDLIIMYICSKSIQIQSSCTQYQCVGLKWLPHSFFHQNSA